MESIFSTEILASFITLSLLEIVLGIDNLIFIALIVDNLPPERRAKTRFFGLMLALGLRILMLSGLTWIMHLTEPLFTAFDMDFSVRDLLLGGGGLFLIYKSTTEMHADLGGEEEKRAMIGKATVFGAMLQIVVIDFVFSFDSILTAVGLSNQLSVMVAAVVVAMAVMLFASDYLSRFLAKHPTFKMLALSFILMIGVLLLAEGLHFHVPRGYIYAAFAFSLFVESLNTVAARRRNKR